MAGKYHVKCINHMTELKKVKKIKDSQKYKHFCSQDYVEKRPESKILPSIIYYL